MKTLTNIWLKHKFRQTERQIWKKLPLPCHKKIRKWKIQEAKQYGRQNEKDLISPPQKKNHRRKKKKDNGGEAISEEVVAKISERYPFTEQKAQQLSSRIERKCSTPKIRS